MNGRIATLYGFCMLSTCIISCEREKTGAELKNEVNAVPPPAAIVLPEKFQGEWLEYHPEKSILFEVCDPRSITLEQGGTEFFWMFLANRQGLLKYRIHRLVQQEESIHIYATPNGSLAGTDTTLVIMEPLHTVAGLMRIHQYGVSTDYPAEPGTIYFVGDPETVSPNPPLEICDDENKEQ